MKTKILFVLFLIVSTICINAQNNKKQSVSGTVFDANNNPLSYVAVGIEGSTLGSMTNQDGQYTINVPTGEFYLSVSSLEYESQRIKISINNEEHKIVNITLDKSKTNLVEVTVYGKTTTQQIKEGAFTVNVIDLSKYANTTTDINQVLRRSPGVTIRENGGVGSDFSFKINGLDAKIFIDGVPMENFGSSMTLNNIPVNLVDRVEVYKGVVPAYLTTDALGGAVNIITKSRNQKFIDVSYGYGSFNTHQASFIANIKDRKTGFVVKTSAFFNHSDNDYTMYSNNKYSISLKKATTIIDEEGNPQPKMVEIDKAKRFNDAYTSGMGKIEMGFENVKWADRILFGLNYSKNKKEEQLGSTVNSVYGGRWSENDYIMPSLHFQKDSLFIPRLYTEVYASYGKSTTNIQDTAKSIYDWSGQAIPTSSAREQSHLRYKNTNYIVRANFIYSLNDAKTNTLGLNYSFTTNQQKSYDLLEKLEAYQNLSGLPQRLGKHLVNLTWQNLWLQQKLSTVVSFKFYGMDVSNTTDERKFDDNNNMTGDVVKTNNFKSYQSLNLAARYMLTKDLGIKASVERAYNLPPIKAMFGDGINYLPNTSIKAERSDNINLGAFYNMFFLQHNYFSIDVTGFYRKADNYLNIEGRSQNYQYTNVKGAKLYGFEFEAKYGYKDLINFSVNGSYDKATDDKKYPDNSTEVSLVYKEQLPNRPWIYGNADLSLGKNDLLGKGTRFELSYLYHYTHWFYLTWANLGESGTKNYIPSQNIHSAVASFSWDSNRYNISVEARNFTNELAYDNFRLQKPGRAFFAKFRVTIM